MSPLAEIYSYKNCVIPRIKKITSILSRPAEIIAEFKRRMSQQKKNVEECQITEAGPVFIGGVNESVSTLTCISRSQFINLGSVLSFETCK
jgi:hypothetical protein